MRSIVAGVAAAAMIGSFIANVKTANAQYQWVPPATAWLGQNGPTISQRLPYYTLRAVELPSTIRQYGPQVYGWVGGPLRYQTTPAVPRGYTYYGGPTIPSYRPAMPSFGQRRR
jgi:hypothetical protein